MAETNTNDEREWDAFITKNRTRPVPYYVLNLVVQAIKELRHTIKDLQQQLRDVEHKSMQFEGVWEGDRMYSRGAIVQRSGLWLCLTPTTAKPGQDPSAWRLVVKQS